MIKSDDLRIYVVDTQGAFTNELLEVAMEHEKLDSGLTGFYFGNKRLQGREVTSEFLEKLISSRSQFQKMKFEAYIGTPDFTQRWKLPEPYSKAKARVMRALKTSDRQLLKKVKTKEKVSSEDLKLRIEEAKKLLKAGNNFKKKGRRLEEEGYAIINSIRKICPHAETRPYCSFCGLEKDSCGVVECPQAESVICNICDEVIKI